MISAEVLGIIEVDVVLVAVVDGTEVIGVAEVLLISADVLGIVVGNADDVDISRVEVLPLSDVVTKDDNISTVDVVVTTSEVLDATEDITMLLLVLIIMVVTDVIATVLVSNGVEVVTAVVLTGMTKLEVATVAIVLTIDEVVVETTTGQSLVKFINGE